jgi:hypothetical protein
VTRLRAVDLAIAWRGRQVGRLGVPTAVGNAALALMAWSAASGAGTTSHTRAHNLLPAHADGVE